MKKGSFSGTNFSLVSAMSSEDGAVKKTGYKKKKGV